MGINTRTGITCQEKDPISVYNSRKEEISEKVLKSLITPITNRLHRLECIETKEKSVESFFKISVIRERKVVFGALKKFS